MYCSSHFFQVCWGGGGGGAGRGLSSYMEVGTDVRASGMGPFFRPGNISMGIIFHPQIYESPKC